eukprot:246857-Chlamydomonas_euryale.AAC.1
MRMHAHVRAHCSHLRKKVRHAASASCGCDHAAAGRLLSPPCRSARNHSEVAAADPLHAAGGRASSSATPPPLADMRSSCAGSAL